MVNFMSPARRRSIAAFDPSKPAKKKRRASSLLPSEKRRHLAPRKSILKAALLNEDMEVTQVTSNIASRKSLGHRVSFASHAHVRLFEKPENTNSTESPSSPAYSSPPRFEAAQSPVVNDENAYPGAPSPNRPRKSTARRRSSTGFHKMPTNGEDDQDMEIDNSVLQSDIFLSSDDTANQGVAEDDAMDVTEVFGPTSQDGRPSIGTNVRPRRSTSAFFVYRDEPEDDQTTELPLPTPPIQPPPPTAYAGNDSVASHDMSVTEDLGDITTSTDGDPSHVEFTVPMGKNLNPPKPPSAALLELAAMTHSGGLERDNDHEYQPGVFTASAITDEDTNMSLDDALSRLSNIKRQSLGVGSAGSQDTDATTAVPSATSGQDDSFSSNNDSFEAAEEQTVNMTALIRRASSVGGHLARSLGLGDSAHIPRESTVNMSMEAASVVDGDEDLPISVTRHTVLRPSASGGRTSDPTPTQVLNEDLFGPAKPLESSRTTESNGSISSAPKPPSVFSRPNVSSTSGRVGSSTNRDDGNVAEVARSAGFGSGSVFSRSVSNTASLSENAIPPSVPPSPLEGVLHESRSDHRSSGEAFSSPLEETAATNDGTMPGDFPDMANLKRRASSLAGPNKRVSLDSSRPLARRKSSIGGTGVPPPRAPRTKADIARRDRASIATSEAGAEVGDEGTSLYPNLDDLRAEMESAAATATAEREALVAPPSSSPLKGSMAQVPRRQSTVSASRRVSLRPAGAARASIAGRPRFSLLPNTNAPRPSLAQRNSQGQRRALLEDDDIAPISIENFFEMTGVKFLDDITVPRRSMVHPSQLRSRRSSTARDATRADPEAGMVEDFLAMSIYVPQLQVYGSAAKDLQAWIDNSKTHFAQANEDAQKLPPALFEEYLSIDEEGRADLVGVLKTIKTNSRELTRKHWYETKLEWTSQLLQSTEEALAALDQDVQIFEHLQRQFDAILPSAESETQKLLHELEAEQQEVDEIEGCDQDYLASLKEELNEQTTILDGFRRDLEKDNIEISVLEKKQSDLHSQEQEATAAIDEATRILELQKGSGATDLANFEAELHLVEWLSGWKTVTMQHNLLELVYDDRYRVTIPQRNYKPVALKVGIELDKHSRPVRNHEWFHGMEKFLLTTAKHLTHSQELHKNSSLARMLSDYWTSTTSLRRDLEDLVMPYAHDFEVTPREDGQLSCTVVLPLLFHSRKARADISFTFDPQAVASWPQSLHFVRAAVKVRYGSVDAQKLLTSVEDTIRTSDPQSCRNHLRDAVHAAQDLYT